MHLFNDKGVSRKGFSSAHARAYVTVSVNCYHSCSCKIINYMNIDDIDFNFVNFDEKVEISMSN